MSFIINRMSDMSIVPPNLLQRRKSDVSLNFQTFGSKQELFNINAVPIRNAKKESYHSKKILLIDTFIVFLNILIILITIFKNFRIEHSDEFFQENQIETQNDQEIQYRFLLMFCISVVILNLAKNVCLIHLRQENDPQKQIQLINFWLRLTLQTVFFLIHPSSFTKDIKFQQFYSDLPLNKILSCFVYFRTIGILGFLFRISRFYGLRVKRVLSLHIGDKDDFGILYTIKCYLRQKGLKSPFIIYTTIILTFPFFLMALQTKYLTEESQLLNLNGFLEAIYDIVITMVTVGYGDMGHLYTFQRILFTSIIVIGSISTSFFTLTFLNWVKFSIQQQKAYRSITRLLIKSKINEINSEKVQNFVRKFIEIQKKSKNQQKIMKLKNSNSQNKKQEANENCIEHNQIQKAKKPSELFKNLFPQFANPQMKRLNQRICQNQDTFRDFYQRSQIQLSHSLKLLIQRILLTGNLMEFYIMRQRNNKKSNDLSPQSSQSIKSRRRVDDNIKMYELKMKIIQATSNQKIQKEKPLVVKSQKG